MGKPRMLIVSHVLPFPGDSGQQKRVANMIKALRECFEVDFLTTARNGEREIVRARLAEWVDQAIVLPSRAAGNRCAGICYGILSRIFMLVTGVKYSNYLVGRVELNARRLRKHVRPKEYALVLYEYMHAWRSSGLFRGEQVPCVLDMHDILSRSYERYLRSLRVLPGAWKRYALRRYVREEHRAWLSFDGIVTINGAEYEELERGLKGRVALFYAPMGIDMEEWKVAYEPAVPPRIVYYGGLGNPNNRKDAMTCYERVMPEVWNVNPHVELWLLGSNPSPEMKALETRDPRVRVPGFLADIKPVLGASSLMLCPFTGRFGFRSRIVEAMALGVPVVASSDAVYGMGFEDGKGIFIVDDAPGMSRVINEIFKDERYLKSLRHLARSEAERLYGFDVSYGRAARELASYAATFRRG